MNLNLAQIVESVFNGFKKLTPALLAVAIASGCILFLPVQILSKMGLDRLLDGERTILGIVFLISTILIFVIIVSCIWHKICLSSQERKTINQYSKMYKHLSYDMKNIINEMMQSNDKSIILDEASGNTQYLINIGFIYRPKQYVPIGQNYEFRVKFVPTRALTELYINKPRLFR